MWVDFETVIVHAQAHTHTHTHTHTFTLSLPSPLVAVPLRNVECCYGFMILNRLNNDNLLEEVAPNMEFRVQSPFVLFKKKSGKHHHHIPV